MGGGELICKKHLAFHKNERGVGGQKGTRLRRIRSWRMTGSAFTAMDIVVACFSVEMGGGLEGGSSRFTRTEGMRIPFFMLFQCRFSGRFSSDVCS